MSDFQTVFFVYQINDFWILLSNFFFKKINAILSAKKCTLGLIFFNIFLIISIRHLLSDTQKKRFENPTFIGLARLSRMNTIWGNHLHISNGGLLLANIGQYAYCTSIITAKKIRWQAIKQDTKQSDIVTSWAACRS